MSAAPQVGTDCPSCADERTAGAVFCEACGRALAAAAPAAPGASGADAPTGPPCPACGTPGGVGADGYCAHCGILAVRPRDHIELTVDRAAAVTDRGRRHHRNEDAMWLAARSTGASAEVEIVVCDGVSSSFDPDVASAVAAETAGRVLDRPGSDATAQLSAAVVAAGAAVAALATGADLRRAASNPACTIVAACVRGSEVSYGWVGDSRAYWIAADGPAEQLTEDDSWATHAIRQGVDPQTAFSDRRAHAITAWLGADAGPVEPRTGRFTPDVPGHLVLCSDGLWNYLTDPEAFAGTVRTHLADAAGSPEPLLAAARSLTAFANAAGGSDNITVAITGVTP